MELNWVFVFDQCKWHFIFAQKSSNQFRSYDEDFDCQITVEKPTVNSFEPGRFYLSQSIIIENALIVTCDQNHQIVEIGALVFKGREITWVGSGDDLDADLRASSKIIDARGKILMPGLINTHAHCGDTLFRGLVEDLPLEQWLQTVWKAEAAILGNADTCRLGVELGFAELLLGGVTSVMDMFWHPDQTFLAAEKAGIRLATGGIFFDFDGMDGDGPVNRTHDAKALFERFGDNDEMFVGTMPHGTYTVGPENLRAAIDLANQQNGFFSTHAAETKTEQATIHERYQTSVIRHLNDLDGLSPNTVLAHCVHVDDEELDLMAGSGTHVAHNPLSNLKLASGFAPVPEMQKRGINVTLGTDGAISGNDMDMWLAMRLAATIHKAAWEDPTAVSANEALHMATLNGAKALGAKDYLGSLEIGKRADFMLVDHSGPHASPMFNPINHLVYAANKSDVCDVYVSGRQLVKDKQLTTLNAADICTEVRALQPRIVASLLEASA